MPEHDKTLPSIKEPDLDEVMFSDERAYLTAIAGPNAGKIYLLKDGKNLVGRVNKSDIYLDDSQVSRKHAEFILLEGKVTVTDLGSTNGTVVNGKKIESALLKEGDEISIGSSIFTFSLSTPIEATIRGLMGYSQFDRRLFEELDRASRFKRPLSVMMIGLDFDETKVKGDEKEKESLRKKKFIKLVEHTKALIRTMDIMAYYGRFELELMLPETGKNDAMILAQRILKITRDDAFMLLSIGISSYPEDSKSKDFLIDKSRRALKKAKTERNQIVQSKEDVKTILPGDMQKVVIKSEKMIAIFELVSRIAKSNISVLIQGETGVGKEVIAEDIHYRSDRSQNSLVSVNCAALTETILESELFGYEKGAFTGADQQKIGLFESAKGGTIFLDEIGEMPAKTQAKLLRVLQSKKIMRVGGNREIAIDVRVIAATNKNLEDSIKKGIFREDLYFRLNAITINVPPLRERKEEIPELVDYFVKIFAEENSRGQMSISREALGFLMKYEWPGNVRELKNCIERACVIAPESTILPEHLALKMTSEESMLKYSKSEDSDATLVGNMRDLLENYEREIILNVLKKTNFNQTKAADLLKVPRRTLVSKIRKYDIKKGKDSE